MTNEQCKAIIMGMLEAFGTGQARAHKAQYVDEIMEKAGVNEALGFIVGEDEHGEQHVRPVWCVAPLVEKRLGEFEESVAHLQGIASGMDKRFGVLEKEIDGLKGMIKDLSNSRRGSA